MTDVETILVKNPDGSYERVPRSQVEQTMRDQAAADAAAAKEAEEKPEEVYVHLANGEVDRAVLTDVPAVGAGTNAPFGFWEKDGKTHTIIGVYPVETGS